MINVALKMTKDHCEDQFAVYKGPSKNDCSRLISPYGSSYTTTNSHGALRSLASIIIKI
jgi:hypothetical protein